MHRQSLTLLFDLIELATPEQLDETSRRIAVRREVLEDGRVG